MHVVGPDQRDTDVVHRSWRRLVSRWVREKAPFATPRERLDHEAATALLARASGARVPAVVAVRTFGAGVGVLVTGHARRSGESDAVQRASAGLVAALRQLAATSAA